MVFDDLPALEFPLSLHLFKVLKAIVDFQFCQLLKHFLLDKIASRVLLKKLRGLEKLFFPYLWTYIKKVVESPG